MKKVIKYMLITLVLVSMGFGFQFSANAQSGNADLTSPFEDQIKAGIPASVVDHAWIQDRPEYNSVWFYQLSIYDDVLVDYEMNGYYFVRWYFSETKPPLAGWVEKKHVILNRNITY